MKRKVWILFETFQNKSCDKSWNLEFSSLPILAKCWLKSLAEISQVMRECLFLSRTNFFYLWPHTLRIISAKDIHITKISIVFVPWWHSLRYFSVPCNSAIILGRCCCIALACTLSRWYISLIISWVIHGLHRFLSRKLFVRAYLSHISVYDNFHWSYDISSSSWEPLRMSHGIKSCSKIFASKFFISPNLTVSWSTVGDFVSLNSIWV